MKEHTILKIGEFARIAQVSIATLRHYDQYGLLKPDALDPDTGYRYYSLAQLPRLNRILALRDLDFPLEQIVQLLENVLDLGQLRGMFILKQAQTQRLIDNEQARLMRLAARLRQIEQEGKMPTYEVLLKHVDPLLVASIRQRLPVISAHRHLYATLSAYLNLQGLSYSQPDLLILHSRHELYDEEVSIDVEVAIPLLTILSPTALPQNEQITIRTLPGSFVASTVYTGEDLFLGQAYGALYRWLKENSYQLIGTPRLIHLQHTQSTHSTYSITEVQFPVEKQKM